MFYRLSAREKLILSDPPDFQQPLFRIEWQPISASAGRECGRSKNPFAISVKGVCPQDRRARTGTARTRAEGSKSLNRNSRRMSSCGTNEFKPIEMNTCRKNGRGVPRERLRRSKRIVEELSWNAHSRDIGWKSRGMNTCKKIGEGCRRAHSVTTFDFQLSRHRRSGWRAFRPRM